jgi:hypothetical protein
VVNVLDGFERAYSSDRLDIIWLAENVEAFMKVASSEMQLAMVLALHTGQRQADILKRTSELAANAVAKFENVLETDVAKRAAK